MKKYKVLKDFYDKHTGKLNAEGKTIELSDDRAEEIRENLAAYGEFIEEVADKPKGKSKGKDKEADEVNADEATGETEDNKEVKEAE